MQPNILLIVSDQHRLDCVGAADQYPVRTPHLDALARDGAWFSQAYTPIPLCTPARQSLLTGRRPEATGGLWNYDLGPRIPALDPESYAWPRELSRAGYRTQYVGKWHVHPEHDPTSFGYDSWVALEEYDAWRARNFADAPVPSGWFGGVDQVPTSASRSHWLADRTAAFIRESARVRDAAGEQQPWHARLDLVEPHLPCHPTQEFADRYPPDEIPPWRTFADPLENKPYIQHQQLVNWGVQDYTWADWAPVVARYYAVIEQLDDAIGRVLQALDESGAAANTMVIYTSDHGDMGGSRGMMDKHHVMYDDVVRVPLIVRWPERIEAGTVVDHFTYNMLDLPPTISRVTGIPAPDAGHGVGMFDDDHTDDDADGAGRLTPSAGLRDRQHVVATYNGQQFGLYIQRMIRTREWKYVWNPTDVDELYDLVNDPEEFVNRIDDATCGEVLAELRNRLYEQLVNDDDSFVSNPWMTRQLREGVKLGRTPAVR